MCVEDNSSSEIEAMRYRLKMLCSATLRINESLEFETVLQEVADSARTLTGARYGVIITTDGAGRISHFLDSGLTPEEAQLLWEISEGPLFNDLLIRSTQPLRTANFQGLVESLGFSDIPLPMQMSPLMPFLAVPIGYHGKCVGNIYLAEKENGKEFTSEDEETLVIFASQAAMVISNAHRYREEQRARADLEALVETSPVGVVVFDAKTGEPVSFNREARRIVSTLCAPGGSEEELLEVLTVIRADGRETSLNELPLAQVLSRGETVRAEEITLRARGGRSVTTLVNSTPILSAEGEVESVIVTLQDMTSVEELERLRAEFLAMVSHELRAPLTSIKGSAATLLESLNSLDPVEIIQFIRIIESEADRMRDLISELLDVARIETGTLSVFPQPVEVADLVDEARNTFLSSGGRDNVSIDLQPNLLKVLADRRRIIQVLGNLLSNAARYSPESTVIQVSATQQAGHVAFSVADEGRGVEPDRLPFLFRKFSRIEPESLGRDVSGAGLGLAICKGIVETHGGRIWAESEGAGSGTKFIFTLPVAPTSDSNLTIETRDATERHDMRTRDHILAVDDDPQTLRLVRDTLAKAGYIPHVAVDSVHALRLVAEHKPRLVLLDLMLPGGDGMELMNDISNITDVPVIFLSGYGQDNIIAKAFELGAADYVVKPFSQWSWLRESRPCYAEDPPLPRQTRWVPIHTATCSLTIPNVV